MSRKVNIYAKDGKGDMFLLKDNITPDEAIIICDDYYKNTGLTSVMILI